MSSVSKQWHNCLRTGAGESSRSASHVKADIKAGKGEGELLCGPSHFKDDTIAGRGPSVHMDCGSFALEAKVGSRIHTLQMYSARLTT